MEKFKGSNRLYHGISRVLVIGIIASIAVMIFGFILLVTARTASTDRTPSIAQLIQGVISLEAYSVIVLATIILILTPITRVITATILFMLEKDTRYSIITFSVLILLIASLLIGIA